MIRSPMSCAALICSLVLGSCKPGEAVPPEDGAADAAAPADAAAATDAAAPADARPAEPPLFGESLVGTDVPVARVGMFYLAWHAPAATAMRTVAARGGATLTIEDVVRGKGSYADVLQRWGLEGDAMSFYYHARPRLGFY